MRKQLLLSAVAAFSILALTPAVSAAQEGGGDNEVDLTGDAFYLNLAAHLHGQAHLNASLTGLLGGVTLDGMISADSSAQAYIDTKQILRDNRVEFREEPRRDGRSGGVDSDIFGFQVGAFNDGFGQPIEIGWFSPMINTVEEFDVDGSGNVGLNIAAGWYNAQQNDAALATSGFVGGDDGESGGWSEASLLSLQLGDNNYYGSFFTPEAPEREDDTQDFDDYRDRNTVSVGTINGDGNIGVNAAAGAFNIQQNALAMAVSEDSVLAKATAVVFQTAYNNNARLMDSVNVVSAGSIGGSGNIGVNLASGVGNMQHNSLTMAVSAAGGATPPPPPPPPPGGGGDS